MCTELAAIVAQMSRGVSIPIPTNGGWGHKNGEAVSDIFLCVSGWGCQSSEVVNPCEALNTAATVPKNWY